MLPKRCQHPDLAAGTHPPSPDHPSPCGTVSIPPIPQASSLGPGVCSEGLGRVVMPLLYFRAPFADQLQTLETGGDLAGLHEMMAHKRETKSGRAGKGSPGRAHPEHLHQPCQSSRTAQPQVPTRCHCRQNSPASVSLQHCCPSMVSAFPCQSQSPRNFPIPSLLRSLPAPALTLRPRPSCGRRSSSRAGRAGG